MTEKKAKQEQKQGDMGKGGNPPEATPSSPQTKPAARKARNPPEAPPDAAAASVGAAKGKPARGGKGAKAEEGAVGGGVEVGLEWPKEPVESSWFTATVKTWTSKCGRYRVSRIEGGSRQEKVEFGAERRTNSHWEYVKSSKMGPGYPLMYNSLALAMEACETHLEGVLGRAVESNKEAVVKGAGVLADNESPFDANDTESDQQTRRGRRVRKEKAPKPPREKGEKGEKAPKQGGAVGPSTDRWGHNIGKNFARIHNALTEEPRTAEEIEKVIGDDKFPAKRIARKLRTLMGNHPECKVAEAAGKFSITK